MYVEKIFKRKNREAERELKRKNRETKWELKRERILEKQRRLFEQYVEEARNNTELIDQIPYNLDGSLYRELREEYESVERELHVVEMTSGVYYADTIGICSVLDGVTIIISIIIAMALLLGLAPKLVAPFMAIMILIIVPMIGLKRVPRFSKKRLRLAAESKVVCECIEERQPEIMAQRAAYEIVP